MIGRMGSYFKRSLLLAGVLALIATGIWLFRSPNMSLSDAFFWAGAVPVMLGTFGGFGAYVGRGDVSFQLSKTTLNQSSTDRAIQELDYLKIWQASAWHWVGAGFIVCVASAFLP